MVTVEDFSRLVSGIYAAAVTPQHWQLAIRDVVGTLDGTGGGLIFADASSRWQVGPILAPEATKSYAEHYGRIDHVLAAVEKGPVGAMRTGDELIPSKPHTEFHADWIRPNGLEDGLFVRLNSRATTSCFVVASPRRSESFAAPERIKLVSGLLPHLQQALRTRNEFEILARGNADLAAALEIIGHGMIIVGPGCRVIHLNSAAERILGADDGICIRSGRIAATSVGGGRELNRTIHVAVTGDGSDIRSGGSFTYQRPSGKRSYVIHVLPLQRTETSEISSGATAIVLIIDPERENEDAQRLLRRIYGCTTTESEVALRLARGADLKQISDELSISLSTVRTHLQHLFDKTTTHRQAELVQHLLAISR